MSPGGSFADPFGIAIDANGDLLVADRNFQAALPRIIRVDPVTGAQTIVSSGGSLSLPLGIATKGHSPGFNGRDRKGGSLGQS